MNEADSSPGNGAPVEAAAPAAPTATPTAPALDLDALVSRLTGVIDEKILASQNATHAALRKAGVFKQDKPSDVAAPAPTQPTPSAPVAAQAGLSAADVQSIIERDRILTSRAAKFGLSESQASRFRAAHQHTPIESLATEADSYLTDMGLAKAPPVPVPTPPPAQAPAAPAKPNISDRGAAVPTDLRDSEGVVNSRPLETTGHDVDQLRLKYGDDKGLQMFQERINAALRGIKIATPGGRQR